MRCERGIAGERPHTAYGGPAAGLVGQRPDALLQSWGPRGKWSAGGVRKRWTGKAHRKCALRR